MDELTKSLSVLKSYSTVDKKIEAIHTLEVLFTNGLPDDQYEQLESTTNILKLNLRSPNAQLGHAVIAILPTYIPILTDASNHDYRQLKLGLGAFLAPPNGLIEKLADQKERIRDAARAGLMALSIGALKFGSQPQSKLQSSAKSSTSAKDTAETPWIVFEKALREQGLGGKAWRIREQSLLHLATLHPLHSFPLRSFLSQFVTLLEDSDSSVREAARSTIITLFRNSSAQAKTSLKKEITDKGIKKNVADEILDGVLKSAAFRPELIPMPIDDPIEEVKLAGSNPHYSSVPPRPQSSFGFNRGGAPASTQPQAQPAHSDVEKLDPVYTASSKDLEKEFEAMHALFSGKETEQNWIPRETQIKRLRGMLRGEVHLQYADLFVQGVKSNIDGIMAIAQSLRTTLSLNAINLCVDLSQFLRSQMDSFAEPVVSCLMRMATLTKKIVVQHSQNALSTILHNVSYSSRILNVLQAGINEKAPAPRQYSITHLRVLVETHSAHKHLIEQTGGVTVFEGSIKKALADANPGVREQGRTTYWSFHSVWPAQSARLIESLDPTARKQLEKAKTVTNPAPQPAKKGLSARSQQFKEAKAAFIARNKSGPIPESTIPLPDTPHKLGAVESRSATPSQDRSPPQPADSRSRSATPVNRTPPQQNAATPIISRTPPEEEAEKQDEQEQQEQQVEAFEESEQIGQHEEAAEENAPPASPMQINSPSTKHSQDEEMSSRSPTPLRTSNRAPSMSTSPKDSSPLRQSFNPNDSNSTTTSKSYGSPPHRQSPLAQPAQARRPSERLSVAMMGSHSTPFGSLMQESQPDDWQNNSAMDDTFLLANKKSEELDNAEEEEEEVEMMRFDDSPLKLQRSSNKRPLSHSMSSTRSGDTPKQKNASEESEPQSISRIAESTANHLLEVNEELASTRISNEDETNEATPVKHTAPAPAVVNPSVRQSIATPPSKMRKILQQAQQVVDSPMNKAGTPRVLHDIRKVGGSNQWWLNRVDAYENKDTSLRDSKYDHHVDILERLKDKLVGGESLTQVELDQLNSISVMYPTTSDKENNDGNIWNESNVFTSILEGALLMLDDATHNADQQDATLRLLRNLIEKQADLLIGSEMSVFNSLIKLRLSSRKENYDASDALMELFTDSIDPICGVGALESAIEISAHNDSSDATKSAMSFSLALKALGRLFLRLPAEVLEEEIPRVQDVLMKGLNYENGLVRQSAVKVIVAAQSVLRDENKLFELGRIPESKKGILTYYINRVGLHNNFT